MSALKFYPIKVKEVRSETTDCVSVLLDMPADLADKFRFVPGQYLTFRKFLADGEIRRSYSICSGINDGELRVAIKKVPDGKFSTYANTELKAGDILETMPPMGNFTWKKTDGSRKEYVAFAAGSGITPILSIVKSVLEEEPNSTFTLIYGNKSKNSIIFREAIEALKNKYMLRLRIYYVLSREYMEIPLFSGRINAAKCVDFCQSLVDVTTTDAAYLCGPEEMILSVRQQLIDLGMPASQVHMELFSSPDQPKANLDKSVTDNIANEGPKSKVIITLDGNTFELSLGFTGESILDAALKAGADLPYACKGGVCCTCRALVTEGETEMDVNYALDEHEVQKGYILTCQAHPRTERVVIDFDAR
jgi:ring-1,2-phenylacetyl-CoA epoxidase subunit PaaE